jgi:hypothetical protein
MYLSTSITTATPMPCGMPSPIWYPSNAKPYTLHMLGMQEHGAQGGQSFGQGCTLGRSSFLPVSVDSGTRTDLSCGANADEPR